MTSRFIQFALDPEEQIMASRVREEEAVRRFRESIRHHRAHYSEFVGGDGSDRSELSWNTRRRIMAALRQSTRVIGVGQKSRIGRLGAGTAIGAAIAGFASPAIAQYAAGGGSATGPNSVAIGSGASATHVNGVATGTSNTATGDNAVAIGSNNNVNSFDGTGAVVNNGILDRAVGGNYIFPDGSTQVASHAVGIGSLNTVAVGGLAIGTSNQVNGGGVTALGIGLGNVTSGGFGVSLGVGNRSSATSALAIGTANTASGNTAIAMGRQNTASGQTSIALGNVASATQTNAIAIGHSTQATAGGAIAIGGGNNGASTNLDGTAARASGTHAIALGTNASAAAVAATEASIAIGRNASAGVAASGSTLAIGSNAVASTPSGGGDSLALGTGANATGQDSLAIGGQSVASATNSIAIGNNSTTATQSGAVALGVDTDATGTNATALGVSSVASGTSAVAMGNGSTAAGTNAIAIGTGNLVSGNNSGAIGDPNTITGSGSYALGNNNTINADNAFAIGNSITIAAGRNGSVGIGDGTTVSAPNTGAYTLNGGTAAATTPSAVVSVGAAAAERQITNVAAGVVSATSTDAINGSQLYTVAVANNNLGTTVETIIGNGTNINADGTLNVAPTFAVAGSSYSTVANAFNALNNANTTANNGLASALGGGTSVAANGTVTAPSYTIGASTYNNVGDALQAISGGFNLTSSATGTGTMGGTTVEAIGAGETVTVQTGDNLRGTQSGNTISLALNPNLTGITSLAITGGPTINGSGIALAAGDTFDAAGSTLANVGAGAVNATSTDAVNGSQLFASQQAAAASTDALGASVASNLGGAASYNPATDTITGLAINVGGTTYGNVTDAIEAGDDKADTGLQDVADALGAGSAYDPATGAITAPSFSVAGGTQSNVGAAFDALDDANTLSNTGIASAIGGGMAIGADGTVTAPSFSVNGSSYNNVGDALSAAGAGFNFTTSATGSGVANSTSVSAIGAGETHIVTAGDNIVTTQSGNDVAIALNPALTGITSLAVTGGATIDASGINMNGDGITGLAAGSTAAGSTAAVNGGQLNTAMASVATDLGGGASYNPVTGQLTAPGYAIDGIVYNNVGDALAALAADSRYVDFNSTLAAANASGANASAIGPNAQASGNNASAFGVNSDATGTNSLALGSGAVATGNNSVALGSGSQAGVNNAGWTGTTFGGVTMTNAQNANAVVSVSGGTTNRQITGVADGAVNATSTDAVNGAQLFNTATALNTMSTNIGAGLASSLGGGAAVAPNGTITNPTYNVAGGTQNNVGDALGALNTVNNLANAGIASAIGGGASVAPNGTVTAPTVNVNGTSYNNLTDAIQAAGGGFNLTTAATGTGVANGTSVSQIGAGETHTLTAGNNIITTQNGNEVQVAVNPVLTGLTSVSVTGGPTLSATGVDMGGDQITNLGAGSTAPGSTDAVNGGQINTGLASVATNLGGGSAFDPVTGAVTAPSYSVQGSTYNNVGTALGAVDSNLTNILNGTAGLVQQVGGSPGAGQITVGAATGGASVSFSGTSGNRVLTDVAAGAITALSDDAVNGSQIFANNQQISNLLGGGAGVDPTTGALTAPSYNVGGNTLGDVGSAIAALQSGAPVQYSTAGAPTTPNGLVPSQNMTLVGSAPGTVTLSNVGPASLTPTSTDAVNGSQLNTLASSNAAIIGGGSSFDPVTGTLTAPTFNVAGGTQNNVGEAFNAINTANDTANSGIASVIGGGMAIGPNGAVTNPNFNVNGSTYGTVADAIQAAGAGFNLTTAATGTGTITGTTIEGIGAGETVTVTAGNNLVGTQSGNAIELGLNPVLTGITSLEITGGPALGAMGINMNGGKITGMAFGDLAAASTDAVNGSQINNLATAIATNFGGGSTFDPVAGTVMAPSYTVQGSTYNNVGSALGGVDMALTNLTNGTSGLVQQVGGAPGNGLITVGAATGGTTVSFAGNSGNRLLTDVAPGALTTTSDDVVNGAQVNTGLTSVADALGGGSTFDPVTGEVTAPTFNVAGGTQNNVGDAFNAINTANDTANNGIANVIGGGMAIGPNGAVTNPTFNVNGSTYGTVADALAAAGGGFNLTTAATGTGVANGTAVEQIGAGETQTLTAGNNIVTTQNGNEVQIALNSNLTGIDSITLNNGLISGLAAGSTAAGSTDAINGGQFNISQASVANNFGGGSTYDPVTGTVTAPVYIVQGSSYDNVGDAFGGVNTALTNLTNGTTGLVQQVGGAPGAGQITVGAATGGNSMSVAGTDGNRVVTGVAAGALAPTSTDAVNGGQVNALASSVATNLGGGSTFDPVTGTLTAPAISVGGNSYNNVTAAIEAGDDKTDEGLADVAAALGGGASYNPATGAITGPNYVLGGNSYNNVGGALSALANGGLGPVQFSNATTRTTPNGGTPTNNLTLVGATAGPVTLSNIAPGALTTTSTDAVNGSQLNTGLSSVASGLGGGSTFNASTGAVTNPAYNVQGGNQNNVGDALTALNSAVNNINSGNSGLVQQTGGAPGNGPITVGAATGGTMLSVAGTAGNRVVSGVAAGAVNASSSDAVNGAQLHALQQNIAASNVQTQTTVNNAGRATASHLGGGSAYDPATGQITAPTYNVAGRAYNNVGDAFAATNRAGVQYVPDANGNPTNVVQLSGANTGQPVAVRNVAAGAVNATSTDAVNGSQLHIVQQTAAGAVQYDRNNDGSVNRSAVSFGTPGTPVQLRNVAPAVVSTDAVNLGQMQASLASNLSAANAYADGRFNELSFDLRDVAKKAYAGTASALALQSPALFDPGTVSMRGGVGYFRGEWALGLGFRATADNGRWSFSGGISGGPNAGVAASAGVDILIGD